MEITLPKTLSSQEEQLLQKIEYLKTELIELGILIGLNHPTTISLSQRLDALILEYQRHSFPS
jgi:Spo0E like sporulation regulatory protein